LFLLIALLAIAIYAQPFDGSGEGKKAKMAKKGGDSTPFGGFRMNDGAGSEEWGKDGKNKKGKKGGDSNPFGGFRIEGGSSSSEDEKKKGKKGDAGNPFGGFRMGDGSSEKDGKKDKKSGGNPFGGFRMGDGSSEKDGKKGKKSGGSNPFGNFRVVGAAEEDVVDQPVVTTQLPPGVPPVGTRLNQWNGYAGQGQADPWATTWGGYPYASNSYIMGSRQVNQLDGFNYRFPNTMMQPRARVAAPAAAPAATEIKPVERPAVSTRTTLPAGFTNNRFAPVSNFNRAPVWGQPSYGGYPATNYGSYNLGSYPSRVRPAQPYWG